MVVGLLSFFDGFLLRFLFFHGLAGFCGARLPSKLHATVNDFGTIRWSMARDSKIIGGEAGPDMGARRRIRGKLGIRGTSK